MEKYRVWEIGYNEAGKISLLKIADEKNAIVFSYPKDGAVAKTEKKAEQKVEPKVENADFVEVTANSDENRKKSRRKTIALTATKTSPLRFTIIR